MEYMFPLVGVSAFLTALKGVLNFRSHAGTPTVVSGIISLLLAIIAYDMCSPVLLSASVCIMIVSWLLMLRDTREYCKRYRKYRSSSDYQRRAAIRREADRQAEIERLFKRIDRTDY